VARALAYVMFSYDTRNQRAAAYLLASTLPKRRTIRRSGTDSGSEARTCEQGQRIHCGTQVSPGKS
jgi:hypothetical protein